jgi:hypothetical protein
MRICIRNNGKGGNGGFANIDYAGKLAAFSQDLKPHDCELPPLQPVQWEGLEG